MINFRFHLVSLVAVFLALAIGVVMGYGVLGQPTVEGLQNRIDAVAANAEARRRENDQLRDDLARANDALDQSSPFAVTNRLPNVPVAVVAVRGVDGDSVARLVTLARRAGAVAPGIIWLEDKWKLEAKGDVQSATTLLGLPASDKRAAVRAAAWQALATRLEAGAPAAGTHDVLAALASAGFVGFDGAGANTPGAASVGGFGTRVILSVGTAGAVAARTVVGTFASAAVQAGVPLVAGAAFAADDKSGTRGAALTPVLDDGALAAKVTTVDDLEWTAGSIAAVLGLADLGRGVVGHYGFGDGATRLIPEWSAP